MGDTLQRPSDKQLARDYLLAMQGGIVHPKTMENAEVWVRLCSLRSTRDPSAWVTDPMRKEIVNAAWDCLDGEKQ